MVKRNDGVFAMERLRDSEVVGAVVVVLGLVTVYFGVAYLLLLPAQSAWGFWGQPELGILFVSAGLLLYGEGVWTAGARRRSETSSTDKNR